MIKGHSDTIRCLKVNEYDDQHLFLISSSRNGKILVHEITANKRELVQTIDQIGDVRCLNLNKHFMVAGVHHGEVSQYKINTDIFEYELNRVSKAEFCCFDLEKSMTTSKDCNKVVGMNNKNKFNLLCEDFIEDTIIEFIGHKDIITALVFAEEYKVLLSTGRDKSLVKWNQNTAEIIKQIHDIHEDEVFSIERLTGTPLVATGGKDKVMKLLNFDRMEIIGDFFFGNFIYGILYNKPNVMCFGKNRIDICLWNVSKFIKEFHVEDMREVHNGNEDSLKEEMCNGNESKIKVKTSTDTHLTKKKDFPSVKINGDNNLECNDKFVSKSKYSSKIMFSF